MKPIPDDARNNAISLIDSGLSSRKIEAQTGVGRRTVDKIRAQDRPDVLKSVGGRPSRLTATNKRWLVRSITSGRADNAVELKQNFVNDAGIDVSTSTVRRALKESGLKSAVKKKKPKLLPRHIKARRDFALRYQSWTVDDWKRVIWTDETKINRLGSDGRNWVWKKKGSPLTEQQVNGTVKFGGGNLKVWGCMTYQGVGYSTRIDGQMDAGLYAEILNDEFLKTLEYYGLDKDEIIFQQDNDSKHTSGLVRKWFESNNIEVLQWPAQSPDLNPIEHLWNHLKRQLAGYETEPTSIHQLWERVEVEWEKIPLQVCTDLIESMPMRIDAVLKAKGGYTKY